MRKRMKEILRDRRASSFPMTIGIVLSLIILMCGISEYFRLQVIAAGVRESLLGIVIAISSLYGYTWLVKTRKGESNGRA